MASTPAGIEPGGLHRAALMELWCWFWAGIAEREYRIWREFESSRDIRKEKQACIELRQLMLRHLPPSTGASPGDPVYPQLTTVMPPSNAAAFEAELRG